ncbi:MAG: hypothetical protein IJ679_13240 [Lachnospiraceae bacterium]|nr:hypothetical protein [Lachnospiraceae bacterium]
MSETKIVPALCTQCGGQVEVDPTQETAICPFCGTSFIVDRAITNYNIDHATIEHADNVNIDVKGAVDSVLEFAGEQMSEHRKERQEERREERARDAKVLKYFFLCFGGMCIIMIILWFIMTVFGLWGDEDAYKEESAAVCVEATSF